MAVSLTYRWQRSIHQITLDDTATVKDLQSKISSETLIPLNRIKILGIKHAGHPPNARVDEMKLLTACSLVEPLMVIGSSPPAEEEPTDEEEAPSEAQHPDSAGHKQHLEIAAELWRVEKVKERFARVCRRTSLPANPPMTPQKNKLLVFDVDYTLFDCKLMSKKDDDDMTPHTRVRPFLEYMVKTLEPHFHYILWSQTSTHWINVKCEQMLKCIMSAAPPLCTLGENEMIVVDSAPRLNISEKSRRNEVKALELIWRKSDNNWNATNTLHVDDLPRNFVLNPSNGLVIKPYRRSQHGSDYELLALTKFLVKVIAPAPDVRVMKTWHDWRDSEAANT